MHKNISAVLAGLGITALITGSGSTPALASAAHASKTLAFQVCKYVEDHDSKPDKGSAFKFLLATDRDRARIRVRDGECKNLELKLRDDHLLVKELVSRRWNVHFNPSGAYEGADLLDRRTVILDLNERSDDGLTVNVHNVRERH